MTYLPWIICAFLLMVCLVSFADINKARKALRKAEAERDDLITQRDHLLQRLQSNE
jgi:CHASE3 domain sensor protein